MSVSYAEGDVPIGAPEDLAFVQAYMNYDYRYFVDGGSGYAAPVLLGNTQSLDEEVMVEAQFRRYSQRRRRSGSSIHGLGRGLSTNRGGRSVSEPDLRNQRAELFRAYTIEGAVAAPPPAAAAPEPATWAMMFIGFAGLGHARGIGAGVSPQASI